MDRPGDVDHKIYLVSPNIYIILLFHSHSNQNKRTKLTLYEKFKDNAMQ